MSQINADFLVSYPEHVQVAAQRLLCDPRMQSNLGGKFCSTDFRRAVDEFEQATISDSWSKKSQRARDLWAHKFENAVTTLIELMDEAPCTPEQWGFPARDNVLMNVLYRIGVPLPEPEDSLNFYKKMRECESAANAECWTLVDALKHYRERVRMDCDQQQVLRKPGDQKAGRAEFIIHMRLSKHLSASDIATIASIMFDDEAIDDRLVRRLTAHQR